jgi:REP element-mobilizing transposase RayT
MREMIAEIIVEQIKKNNYKILACTILRDHVHLVIIDNEENIGKIIKNIKGISACEVNRQFQLSVEGCGYQNSLWAKGYNISFIKTRKQLKNAVEYVKNNHKKHEERWEEIDVKKINQILDKIIINAG